MGHMPKTGRRASLDERKRAQDIVDLYMDALENGGEITYDADDPETRSVFVATIEGLLGDLQRFARTGTFEITNIDRQSIEANSLKRQLKHTPPSGGRAREVADELGISERTAYRRLKAGKTAKR